VPTTWDCSGPCRTPPGIPDLRLLRTSRNLVSPTDVLTACLRYDGVLSALARADHRGDADDQEHRSVTG
jgi:hypothetical protein